jgi:hypothetical protein
MLRSIGDWIRQLFAGHYLVDVEERLDRLRNRLEAGYKQIAQMKDTIGSCKNDIKALPKGKTLRYPIWDFPELFAEHAQQIGVRRIGDMYQIGLGRRKLTFERAKKTREKAVVSTRGYIKRALKSMDNEIKELKEVIVPLQLFEKECRKYSSRAKRYKTKAQKKFPIDLEGWRYLDALERGFEKVKPTKKFNTLAKWLKDEEWDEIKVTFNFKPYTGSYASWFGLLKDMRVDLAEIDEWTKESFDEALDDILQSLRHELQHVGQDILEDLLSLEAAGTPALPLPVPRARVPHPLKEEEFYPRVADEIDEFMGHIKHPIFDMNDPKQLRELFDEWVIEGEFFEELRTKHPAKWRKAVKEFVKGLRARGIEIPGK